MTTKPQRSSVPKITNINVRGTRHSAEKIYENANKIDIRIVE